MPEMQNPNVHRHANLAIAFQELLTAITRLRFKNHGVSSEESFRNQVKESLRRAMHEGSSYGYAPDDVKIAAYAVVAFLDETILHLRSPAFAQWPGQPLQHEVFGKDLAGEEFFVRIQQLLGRRDSVEVADILEIFYLCLLLGYRGRYDPPRAGELNGTIQNIRDKIARSRGINLLLSPQAMLPSEPPPPKLNDPWFRRLAMTAAVAAFTGVAVFVLCKILLISGSSELHALTTR